MIAISISQASWAALLDRRSARRGFRPSNVATTAQKPWESRAVTSAVTSRRPVARRPRGSKRRQIGHGPRFPGQVGELSLCDGGPLDGAPSGDPRAAAGRAPTAVLPGRWRPGRTAESATVSAQCCERARRSPQHRSSGRDVSLGRCGGPHEVAQDPLFTEMFAAQARYPGFAIGTQLGFLLSGFLPFLGYGLMTDGVPGRYPVGTSLAAGPSPAWRRSPHATGAACRCSNSALPAVGAAPADGGVEVASFRPVAVSGAPSEPNGPRAPTRCPAAVPRLSLCEQPAAGSIAPWATTQSSRSTARTRRTARWANFTWRRGSAWGCGCGGTGLRGRRSRRSHGTMRRWAT